MPTANKPKILLIGSSHSERIFWAYEQQRNAFDAELIYVNLNEPALRPWLIDQHGAPGIGPHLAQRLNDVTSAGDIDLYAFSIGGSSHYILGSVNHPCRYDFVYPYRKDLPLDTTVRIIPFDLVRAWFVEEETRIHEPFRVLKAHGVPSACIIPPPPVFDASYVLDRMSADMKIRGQELGIGPAAFRLKIWLTYVDVIREIYGNAYLIPPPAASVDEQGFIRAEYRGDAVHGTIDYGGLVLRQLIDHLPSNRQSADIQGKELIRSPVSVRSTTPLDLKEIRTIKEIRLLGDHPARSRVTIEVAIEPGAWVPVSSLAGTGTDWTNWRAESHAWARFVRVIADDTTILWNVEILTEIPQPMTEARG